MAEIGRAEWQHLSPLLDELLALPAAERGARLAALRTTDPAAADRLDELLAFDVSGSTAALPGGTETAAAGGRVVGAWTLERPLGEGGMGSVWLARRSDGHFDGVAAVKLPHLALLGPEGRRRFAREAQALARLAHPHIAALHDAGVTPEGQPYLVLEHVDGRPIDRHCDDHRLGLRERIVLVLQMLDAVAHAHAQLVLHRDLKAANVLVTADGRVKLLDFGIAQLLEDGAEAAATQHVFTPDSAAPEQVQGGTLGTATDVYAAGVLLYRLLAGVHPTAPAGAARADRLQAVLHTDAPPLHAAAAQVPPEVAAQRGLAPAGLAHALAGDLASIVARALKKDPAERYADARELAADLRRHLAHEPVQARPDSLRYRAARFVRRHRAGAAAAALVALALLAGGAGTAWQAAQAARERDRAVALAQRSDAMLDFFTSMLSQAAQDEKPVTVPVLLQRSRDIALGPGSGRPETDAALLMMLAGMTISLGDGPGTQQLLDAASQRLDRAAVADDGLRALLLCSQGHLAGNAERTADAARLFERGLALAAADPVTRGQCLLRRAFVAQNHNDAEGALRDARQAQALLEAAPAATPLARVEALANVAFGHHLAGQTAEADAAYAQAMQRLRAIGQGVTPLAVTVLNNWGIASYAAGDVQRARQVYDEALQAAARLSPDGSAPVYLLRNLGMAELDLAQTDAALATLARARSAALAGGDRRMAGLIDLGVAYTWLDRGDLAAVQRLVDGARQAFGPDLPADSMPAVTLQGLLARTALVEGRPDAARDVATRVIDFFDRRRMRVAPVVNALRVRTEAALAQGRLDDAAADLQRAQQIAQALQGSKPFSTHAARLLPLQQRLEAARGQAPQAQATARRAVEQLTGALGPGHPDTLRARALAGTP